eukprot:s1502_g14.t1
MDTDALHLPSLIAIQAAQTAMLTHSNSCLPHLESGLDGFWLPRSTTSKSGRLHIGSAAPLAGWQATVLGIPVPPFRTDYNTTFKPEQRRASIEEAKANPDVAAALAAFNAQLGPDDVTSNWSKPS